VRTGTLLAAERSEIDFARALWTIPCAHLKLTTDQVRRRKGAPLVLPLSPLALRLLRRLFALGGERSKYVVTSPVTADEPLHDKALNKAVRRMFKRGALSLPGGPCVPHDLRRTARTHMAALGIPSEIAERCLGHVVAGRVEGTYDRHAYVDEMRAALDKWAERLSALVEPATPANVVPIKRKAPRARAAV
jgi:integrase